jgi:hypothetical protein
VEFLTDDQVARLRNLPAVADRQRVSGLEVLRRTPTRTSGVAMSKALDRVSTALAIDVRTSQVQAVPAYRPAFG